MLLRQHQPRHIDYRESMLPFVQYRFCSAMWSVLSLLYLVLRADVKTGGDSYMSVYQLS